MALLPPVPAVLGGGTLFYTFFIFSDRWSGSKTVLGRIIAGIMAALLTIIIRSFSSNVEGIMFAAAFNYAFSPLYDELSMFQKRPGKSKV
jgi:Na+-translocating ferredoxin:NAD+ oxidoreductase RnfD subunit